MAKREPMTQQKRSAKAAAKRRALGEVELRHRVRPGIRTLLDDLMAWHEIEQQAEAMQLLIMNAHALGPTGSAAIFKVPRHDIEISESVALEIRRRGQTEAARMDHLEHISST